MPLTEVSHFSGIRPRQGERPVAIGGVGGSGTRLIAQLLVEAGFYIGSDLNHANDNLWAALLFNRRDILLETRAGFEILAEMFFARMRGNLIVDDEVSRVVKALVRERTQHRRAWLEERALSFLSVENATARSNEWAWKIPPTHVVAERFLEYHHGLRYIHVVRNGLDMALSGNQNQLLNWGPIFLGRDVENTPRDSLAYWCCVHRRISALAASYPDRVLLVDFDRFCLEPHAVASELLAFCGTSLSSEALGNFAGQVKVPDSTGRFRAVGLKSYADADIRYVESWGYPIR